MKESFSKAKNLKRGNFESNKIFLEKTKILKPQRKILEIGSGKGHLVRYLLDQSVDVIGSEIREEYIQFAKRSFDVNLQKVDGTDLPFDKEFFDIVLSFDVFEHIPDTDEHLQEVHRVLKKGGYYLLGTPNKWTNTLFSIIKNKSFTRHCKYHCSLHDYWEIKRRFQKHGFSVKFEDVPIVNRFFITKLRRYMGSLSVGVVKILNLDKFPIFLQTNFYIIARKI